MGGCEERRREERLKTWLQVLAEREQIGSPYVNAKDVPLTMRLLMMKRALAEKLDLDGKYLKLTKWGREWLQTA